MLTKAIKAPLEKVQKQQKIFLLLCCIVCSFSLYFPATSPLSSFPPLSPLSIPFRGVDCSKKIFDSSSTSPYFSLHSPLMELVLRPTYHPEGYDVRATYYQATGWSKKGHEEWTTSSPLITFDSTDAFIRAVEPHFVYFNGKEQIKGSAKQAAFQLVNKKPVFEFDQPLFERTWA